MKKIVLKKIVIVEIIGSIIMLALVYFITKGQGQEPSLKQTPCYPQPYSTIKQL